MTNVNYSKSGSFVGKTGLDMSAYLSDDSFDYEKFHKDYFEGDGKLWEQNFIDNSTRNLSVMERFGLTYRSDYLEIQGSIMTRMSKPWYTVQEQVAATWNNSLRGSIKWTIGESGVEISTDANYRWYNGYTTAQEPQLVWNAKLAVPLFKRQATLALDAYDLLDQARNLQVSVTDNYYQETRNNTLGRYLMLTFTWRFGNFGGQRGGNRMGPPMGGPGGRGGFRPPMGGGFGGRRF